MMGKMMSEENGFIEVDLVDEISRQTGFDKDLIGCWYYNYHTPFCINKKKACKNHHLCKNLESNYASTYENL